MSAPQPNTMKRHLIIPAVVAGLLATSLTAQVAGPAGAPGRGRPAVRTALDPEVLQKFDANGDGKIDAVERDAMLVDRQEKLEAERKAAAEERIREFDKDGDGKLSPGEFEAMRIQVIRRHNAQKPKRPLSPVAQDALKRFDKDGDGKLNDAEHAAYRRDRIVKALDGNGPTKGILLKRFDKDGDGKLNDAEIDAAAYIPRPSDTAGKSS